MRRARAVQLYDAGYKTVAQVAAASYMEIIQKIGPMRKAQAMQIIRSAKVIVFILLSFLEKKRANIWFIPFPINGKCLNQGGFAWFSSALMAINKSNSLPIRYKIGVE